jgi:hypothetical protein
MQVFQCSFSKQRGGGNYLVVVLVNKACNCILRGLFREKIAEAVYELLLVERGLNIAKYSADYLEEKFIRQFEYFSFPFIN